MLQLGAATADKEKSGFSAGEEGKSIRGEQVRICSLQQNLSDSARRRFLETDRIPVLVETNNDDAAFDEIKNNIECECELLTSNKLLIQDLPRTALNKLASLSAIEYIEPSSSLKFMSDFAHASSFLFQNGARTIPDSRSSPLKRTRL